MRERRWESRATFNFDQILHVTRRLAALGLKPAEPERELIAYVEDWRVDALSDVARLDDWNKEDVTLVHLLEDWRGDFFILAGDYHAAYRELRRPATYCSVSHPFRLPPEAAELHAPEAMLWLGFRDGSGFVRLRLQTNEVVTPGETRDDDRRERWAAERAAAFGAAVATLALPIAVRAEAGRVTALLSAEVGGTPALFCSWPDAFGPCQIEYNASDAAEMILPASRLAATWRAPATVRTYLTGFGPAEFERMRPAALAPGYAWRCSVHCRFADLPTLLGAIGPTGKLYATACEFRARDVLHRDAADDDAWGILGVAAAGGAFKLELRLNRAPLSEAEMADWVDALVGVPMSYAPLPAFAL